MIKQIQNDTFEAVESMKKGTIEVSAGKDMAIKAGQVLQEIIVGSDKVQDIASQVAAASEEQSAAAEQISKNVESISSITTENSIAIQQVARAAEDLNRMTNNLEELVSQFNIEGKEYSQGKHEQKSHSFIKSNGTPILQ